MHRDLSYSAILFRNERGPGAMARRDASSTIMMGLEIC